jgi:glycosyltransferase involved in cell wall biosynthesis
MNLKPISICIPTYNRADKLAQCLEHLCSFSDQDFEVVIGNNCSDDDTDAVVARYSTRLRHLVYLRHATNLGFARNMDAVLRRATRDCLYILNDDDIVFENALDLALSLMQDSEVVGVVGRYYSLRQLNPELTVSFEDAVVTTIGHNAYAALLENLSICDGHPILRRTIYQRHCAYLDRTGTLIPLYFRLISLGKVLAIDRPFFQHRTTGESLTARMAESWFLDMANADLELAVEQALEFLPEGALAKARQRLLNTLYFQAARMSIARHQPYLLWFFLRRLAGIGALGEDVAVLCEHHFSHDMLMERIRRQAQDAQYKHVWVVHGSISSTLARQIGVEVSVVEGPQEARQLCAAADFVWLDDWPPGWADAAPPRVITLMDVLLQIRLTRLPCQVAMAEDRLQLNFIQPDVRSVLLQPNRSFQILCAPYSES